MLLIKAKNNTFWNAEKIDCITDFQDEKHRWLKIVAYEAGQNSEIVLAALSFVDDKEFKMAVAIYRGVIMSDLAQTGNGVFAFEDRFISDLERINIQHFSND